MGIIGVVAALTIPNVNKNTGRAESVAKVKKIYTELNEAYDRATAVYGPIEKWSGGDSSYAKRDYDRITEFMKIQKNCRDSANKCMAEYKCLNNTSCDSEASGLRESYNNATISGILANGCSLKIGLRNGYFPRYTGDTRTGYKGKSSGIFIYVDIDGPNKGKNTWGIDLFAFDITKEGIKPVSGGSYWTDSHIKSGNEKDFWFDCFKYGQKCTAWVINTGNMDYLDADENGKCKHSNKTLSVDNNVFSCK
ncbi:hypothetical protein IJG72_02655 [bacterium]|nr:hypothetical protein [bacterium]